MRSIVIGQSRTVAIVLLVLAGCGTPAPSTSPSDAPLPSFIPAASPTVGATPTKSPSATPSSAASALPTPSAVPSPSASASSAVTDLAIDVHRIDATAAHHVEAFVSLGDQVVWSGGPSDADNDLYRYVPGAPQPQLLFSNPNHDSLLTSIRGSAAGYLFTDERWAGGQPQGWRLWYLAAPGAEPVMVDQSTDDRLIAPTIAMDDHWIAWEVVHGTPSDHLNELLAASVDDPLHPLKLLSYPGRDVYMEFPALWADELWYGIADNDWVANTEKPRVEMINLTQPADGPTVFGSDERAFMPAPGRDVVAWKSGGDPSLSALNSGTLTLYWRATGQTDLLAIPGPHNLAERISYPSVGNRFVAWWDDVRQRLYVYDLAQQQFRRIAEYDLESDEIVARPSLSGDLLAYLHFTATGDQYLEWAVLPP